MSRRKRVTFDLKSKLSSPIFVQQTEKLLKTERVDCSLEELIEVMSGASADAQNRTGNRLREIECLITGKFFDPEKNQWTKKTRITPKEIRKLIYFLKTLQRLNQSVHVSPETIGELETLCFVMEDVQNDTSYRESLKGKLNKKAKHPKEEVDITRTYLMAYLCALLMLRTKSPPNTDSKLNPALTHASKIASKILCDMGLSTSVKAITDAYHRLKPAKRVEAIIEFCRSHSPF